MKGPRVVVITGMHRSGTSLATSLLQQGGVDVGKNLLPASRGNPFGYFEDVDFLDFQQQLLRVRGLDLFVTRAVEPAPTAKETTQAKTIIDRRAARQLWGWKDPRTSLFLEFWSRLLPDARYLFLYRHPLDVLASLMRRGNFSTNGQVEIGLQSWHIYNKHIINFYRKNRKVCVLCNIYRLVEDVDIFFAMLLQKLNLNLQNDLRLENLYHPKVLTRENINKNAENVLGKIYPPAMALYRQIEDLADLPAVPREAHSSPAPDLSGLAAYLQLQPEPLTVPQIRSSLLMLISLIAPGTFEQFYSEISENLRKTTVEHTQLRRKAQVWSEQLQAYETRFQSQDMMTRHLVKLTFNNFLDIWRDPKTIARKFGRWVHFRLKRGNRLR